jgi:acyl carrier protein
MSSASERRDDEVGSPRNDGGQLPFLEQKIRSIMAETFQIELNAINEDTSPDNLDRWTSLKHVDLVLNLQQAFDIEFTDSQIVEELFSCKTIVQTVAAALKERADR